MTFRKAVLTPALALAFAGAAGLAALDGPAPAHAIEPTYARLVSVSGTVTGSPESVQFEGTARVVNRLAPDPDFNSPRFVMSIDMTDVKGIGSLTGKKYSVASEEVVQRRVAASHTVSFSFPFVENGKQGLTARSGKANFALSFDVNTGNVTGASASVTSLN